MPMHILIEDIDNYLKTSGHLLKYYRDKQTLNNNDVITDFPNNTDSALFKFKQKMTGHAGNNATRDAEIIVPLKYLSNIWRALGIPLINCKINLLLTWSANCFIIAGV